MKHLGKVVDEGARGEGGEAGNLVGAGFAVPDRQAAVEAHVVAVEPGIGGLVEIDAGSDGGIAGLVADDGEGFAPV